VTVSLPDPTVEPTLDVPRAGALVGLARSKSYLEARKYVDSDGAVGLPTIAFGSTLRCPTALVLEMLGLTGASSTNGSNGANGDPHQRE
jgi:hypothetical protein